MSRVHAFVDVEVTDATDVILATGSLPMMPPIEISATWRESKVRLSVGAAGGVAAIGEQFTQTRPLP